MPRDDVQIGDNVRRARLSAGLSQAEVSRLMLAAGHSAFYPQTVTRTEQGVRALKLSEAGDLSRILNWPVAGFLPDGLMAELTTPVLAELKRLDERRAAVRETVESYRSTRQDVLASWGPAAEALGGLDEDAEDAATLRVLQARVQRAEAATVAHVLKELLNSEKQG